MHPGDAHAYACPKCGKEESSPLELTSFHCLECNVLMDHLAKLGRERGEPREIRLASTIFDPPAPIVPNAPAKPKRKIRWGSGKASDRNRYVCAACERTWYAHSEISTCPGCRGQFHPEQNSMKCSKRVRTKDLIPEQMHLGLA